MLYMTTTTYTTTSGHLVTILTPGRGAQGGAKCIFGNQHSWGVGPWPGLIDPATGKTHTDGVHHWCSTCGRRKKITKVKS